MDMLRGEVISIGEILVFRRSLQTAAQAQDISVAEGLIVGNARQQQSVGGQVAVARVHVSHVQAQVGVIVTVIGRLDERACHEHVVIPVIVKGDVKGVEARDRVLISCGAKEQGEEKHKEKWGKEK